MTEKTETLLRRVLELAKVAEPEAGPNGLETVKVQSGGDEPTIVTFRFRSPKR